MKTVLKFAVLLAFTCAEPTTESSAWGATPELHDAFVSGTDGYHTYRIPSLVASKQGTLLLFCDARVNSASDKGKMDLVLRRSTDGGRSWLPLQVLFDDPQGQAKIGNVSAVVDRETGAIHAVFCKDLVQAYIRTSTDDGATWSPAVEITASFKEFPFDWKFFATGHAHGIQLKNGRLLIPVFMSSVDRFGGEFKKTTTDFRVGTLSSDDHGRTWHAGGLVPDDVLINESTLFETSDGGVVVNCRSHRRSVRVQARSGDGGATWSTIEATPELRGPACQGSSLVTQDPSGKRVTIFTHVTEDNRSNLIAHLSYDDGRTWPLCKVIEPGRSAYGDLAAGDDGTIYLAYEKDASKRIVVARFDSAWLLDGAESSAAVPSTAAPAEPRSRVKPKLAGIVVDDDAAEYVGTWIESVKAGPVVGKSYHHDDRKDQGKKSARFSASLPTAGEYEVRFLYRADRNRATNANVTVAAADGVHPLVVNQRQNAFEGTRPRALGVFPFAADQPATVTVSNEGADGFVIVDGVQFVRADEAKAERTAPPHAKWVNETLSKVMPIERPANEPVLLKTPTPAAEIDGKSYDVVVFGGTAGGVATAVRAAREGCTVLLVQHNGHVGGMLANGLGQWDAVYGGHRAPLFTELLANIEGYYAGKYGLDSPDFKAAHYTHAHYPIGWCEPHVFEREMNRLLAGESKVTLLYDHHPTVVERDGAMIKSVTFVEHHGSKTITVIGKVFVDGSYEGDLLALAGAKYRVGREARDEFGEPHAGKCFTNIADGPAPLDAAEGRLNIRAYGSKQGSIDPASPFSADGAVQAYNMRPCVTRDPANRIMLIEPPPGYDREEYLKYERRYIGNNGGPNKKGHMNSPILPGENHEYPEADWPTRDKITARHANFALGLIWFLQNDETIPEAKRNEFRQWGLPKDEFADNGHLPYEMYVREARRLVGRHVFTEQDNSLAKGLGRTPIMPDSVAVTEWYMDSHACTTESRPGYKYDGKLILTEESRPAQIPYRALLSKEVDNLLVPVCLSATHIAWGAVRLEPVWMQTGEAAGYAAALSVKNDVTPGKLNPDFLLQTLVEHKQYVSFFNDSNAADDHLATAAAQYFGTKGFFADYDARLDEPLAEAVGHAWLEAFPRLQNDTFDPTEQARRVAQAEVSDSSPISLVEFARSLGTIAKAEPTRPITRGQGLKLLWKATKSR